MAYLPDRVVDHLRRVADEPDLSGTRYTVLHELGRGGGGTVWAAHDAVLERTVALKVVDVPGEERIAARLEHPGIVPVHDAGTLPDGRAFYVMKLVDGVRLDQLDAPLNQRLRVFLKICDAVAFAHSRGVLHRDLKPQNIMVGPFGEVFVLDWGLPGTGTPGYMAPEREQDTRSDVYSLGAILAGWADGAGPVRAIADRACSANPAERYVTAVELAADVTRFLDRERVLAYREPWYERVQRFAARNAVLLLLLAAYVIVRFTLFFLQRW